MKHIRKEEILVEVLIGFIDDIKREAAILCLEEQCNVRFIFNDLEYLIRYKDLIDLVEEYRA